MIDNMNQNHLQSLRQIENDNGIRNGQVDTNIDSPFDEVIKDSRSINDNNGFGSFDGGGGSSSTNDDDTWISIAQGIEFQPAPLAGKTHRQIQTMTQIQQSLFGFVTDSTIDSFETYYEAYSQAWRYLGFYIDCNNSNNNNNNNEKHRERNLKDNEAYCKRYLLWAAYVDLDYQGGGIGEYQYYDLSTDTWDTSACEVMNNERCARMDCHLPDTHFQLLGIYKEDDYTEWFEQLFKHEGYCIWTEDEYQFMQTYRSVWPQKCTKTATSVDDNYLYIDLKPLSGGDMTIGIYKDYKCSVEYSSSKISVNDILSTMYGNNNNNNNNNGGNNRNNDNQYYNANAMQYFGNYVSAWNEGFSVYKVCQPCKAYSLYNYKEKNEHEGHNRQLNDYSYNENSDPNDGNFKCNDDAGYTNVNQCTKFRSKTDLYPASFNDVILARRQNSLARVTVSGQTMGMTNYSEPHGYKLLLYSSIYFGCGFIFMIVAWRVFKLRRARLKKSMLEEKMLSQ